MANISWRATDGDFALPANWTGGIAPVGVDAATFGAGSGTIVGSGSVSTLTFASAAAQAWTLGGRVAFGTQLNVGLVGAPGQVVVGSGGVLTMTGGSVGIANGNNTTGSLTINAGGTFQSTVPAQSVNYLLNVGGYSQTTGSTGTLTVQGAGALLDMNGNGAIVGANSVGFLNILAGAEARLGTPVYGSGATASLSLGRAGQGTVSVSGTGSRLLLSGNMYAGRGPSSSGTVNVTAGGALIETAVATGFGSVFGDGTVTNGVTTTGGTGTLNVNTGGSASYGDSLTFGSNGATGIGTINAGSLTVGAFLSVGTGSAAPGGNGRLTIGNGGAVRVTAAPDLQSSHVLIGNSANSTGVITVTGVGSLLDAGQNTIQVGSRGSGSLTVAAGGTVRAVATDSRYSSALQLGNTTSGSATVTVTGAGSLLDAAGSVLIARGGAGTLVVDQGGSLIGGSAATGDGTGTNGFFNVTIGSATPLLDVTGAANTPLYFGGAAAALVTNGSMLRSRSNLIVGSNGTAGSLMVDSGSTASADRIITIGSGTDRAGGNGTVTVQGGGMLRAGSQPVLGNASVSLGNAAGTTGAVTVSGTGSLLDANGGRLTVGNTGAGTLTISAGGRAVSGANYADAEAALHVGAAAGGSGTISVSGAGSQLVAAGQAVLGGFNTGGGLTVGGTGSVSVDTGGLFRAGSLALFGGSSVANAPTGTTVIGISAGTIGQFTVDAGASVSGAGSISGGIRNSGSITATGGTLILGTVGSGSGTLGAADGVLDVGGATNQSPLVFGGTSATIRLQTFVGSVSASTVTGFGIGDVLDFRQATSIGISGATVTVRSNNTVVATYTVQGLASGVGLAASADGVGGTQLTGFDPLFDAAYYLAQNPDVAAAGVDPYQHYMTTGWTEGRNPSALFNTNYYLNQNADVKAAGINPLAHFEASGWKEGRDPSVGFSVSGYLAANPDVKAAGLDPLVHYLQNGRAEGRAAFAAVPHDTGPHDALVDDAYVYAHNPAIAAAGLDASAWFNGVGWTQGANPDAFFDTNYYLTQNPDVRAAGINPLAHFEASGWREGRQPSLVFDDAKYLTANPDVRAAGLDPLVHYLGNGQAEGRMAFLTGGTAAADPLVNAAYYDKQLGATIIPGGAAGAQQAAYAYDHGGWQAGRNPDAFFDTRYYLSHNPDVAAAGIDPLAHYEVNGWREGRDPSAAFSTNKYLAAYGDVRAAGIDPLLHYVVNGQAEGRSVFTA